MAKLTEDQVKALENKTELTAEEIADCKETFGRFWALKVGAKEAVVDEETKEVISPAVAPLICWVKEPTRRALGYASGFLSSDKIKYQEIILNNAWVAGHPKIKKDNGFFLAAAAQLGKLIDVQMAELEEL